MCCRTVYKGITYRPGSLIPVRSAHTLAHETPGARGKWVGFVRSETAQAIWGATYKIELDIPADGFAEHNRPSSKRAGARVETEGEVPAGRVIYALGNRARGDIRILTRAATTQELATYGHNRMPVTGPSRFEFPAPETP